MGQVNASGSLVIDGRNLPPGEILYYCMRFNTSHFNSGLDLKIFGRWYDLGTTDGTDHQIINTASYWGTHVPDSFAGIWVETGRYIPFSGATGIPPEVNDWLYIKGQTEPAGQIVEVGVDYVVTRFLKGFLIAGDALQIRKIVDENGPIFLKTWNAVAAAADTKAPGVYFPFGNAAYNKAGYLDGLPSGMSGFAFENLHNSTSIRMGGSLGGFIPPAGCNIRVPNVHLTSNDLTNFNAGTSIHTAGTSATRPGILSGGGTVEMNCVSFGQMKCHQEGTTLPSSLSYINVATYCAIGEETCTGLALIEDCVVTGSDPCSTRTERERFLFSNGSTGVTEIKNSHFFISIQHRKSFEIDRAKNLLIENCIIAKNDVITTNGSDSEGFDLEGCIDTVVKNCVSFSVSGNGFNQSTNFFTDCINLNIERFFVCNNARLTAAYTGNQNHIRFTRCDNVRLVGSEVVEGGSLPCYVFGTTTSKTRIYGIGMFDEPLLVGGKATGGGIGFYFEGSSLDVVVARCWIEKAVGNMYELFYYASSVRGMTLVDCGVGYQSSVSLNSSQGLLGSAIRGAADGVGRAGNDGTAWSLGSSSGSSYLDGFRSPTLGWIALQPKRKSDFTPDIAVISGQVKFGTYQVNLFPSAIIEFEQIYWMKQHTGFTGRAGSQSREVNWIGADPTFQQPSFDYLMQYDNGSGWNGVWLDLRDSVALSAISLNPAGSKLKIRIVNNNATSVLGFAALGLETTTDLVSQRNNLWPLDQNFVPINILAVNPAGSPVEGALVYITAAADGNYAPGTLLATGTTNAQGLFVVPSFLAPVSQPFTGWIRKSSGAPYYKQSQLQGTISSTNGLDITAIMIPDE